MRSFAVGLLDDLGLLEDELALLVLLALLEGLLVLPPDVGLAIAAEHVRHRVQPRDQNPVLNAQHDTTRHAHFRRVEKSARAGEARTSLGPLVTLTTLSNK